MIKDQDLEKMRVPKFSGKDYFRWRSIYDVMIHQLPIKDSLKFLRLYACLEAEPKELLKHFPPTDESYSVALEELDSVYGGEAGRITQMMHADGTELSLIHI